MYYILRKDVSAILGEASWVMRDDLFLGICSIATFPTNEEAKKIYNLFSKNARGKMEIVTHTTLSQRWNISVSASGEFSLLLPSFSSLESESIPKVDLTKFVSKQSLSQQKPTENMKAKADTSKIVPSIHFQIPELREGVTDEESWTTKPESQSLEANTLCGHGVSFSGGPVASAVYEASDQLQKALRVLHLAEVQAPLYLAKADKELQDELHFAELYDLSARDGYEVYRRIKELRRKRREAKDAIEAINIAKPIFESITESDLQALKDWIQKKDERVYKLRVPESFVHTPND